MDNMIRVHADLEWHIEQSNTMPVWVGVCDDLQLTAQSRSWRELAEDISETLDAIFLDLIQEDQLNDFLQKNGWELEDEIPSRMPRKGFKFDIPFTIARAA